MYIYCEFYALQREQLKKTDEALVDAKIVLAQDPDQQLKKMDKRG